MTEQVLVEAADGVATLTLNRPERGNALSIGLLGEFCEAMAAQLAAGVRAITVTGAGGRFSAGADLAELSGTLEDLAVDEAIAGAVTAIREAPVPVIAAVEGACVGAGLDLACACDARVASASAFFELPAARLGLLYNPAAVARLRAVLGRPALTRLLVIGERLGAEEALAAGLVSRLVAAGQAAQAAAGLAHHAANNGAHAMAASKALIAALDTGDLDLAHWDRVRAASLSSPERRQAVARAKARVGP